MKHKLNRQLVQLTLAVGMSLGLVALFLVVLKPSTAVAKPHLPVMDQRLMGLKPHIISATLAPACQLFQITPPGNDINDEPAIAGPRLAFWSTFAGDVTANNDDHNAEIFLADVTNPASPVFTQVTTTDGNILGGFNLSPDISADGEWIVFFSDDINVSNPTGNFEIFVANIESGVILTQVTDTQSGFNFLPAINSDGSRLVFASDDETLNSQGNRATEIYLAEPDAGQTPPFTFTQITLSAGSDEFNQDAIISADGQYIVFVSSESGGNNQIFLYSVVTKEETALTTTGNNIDPAISADGSRIVYTAEENNGEKSVYLYDSGVTTVVTAGIKKANPLPVISQNGDLIVFAGDQSTQTIGTELFMTTPGGLVVQITQSEGNSITDQPAISTDDDGLVRVAFASDEADNRNIYLMTCEFGDLKVTKTAFPSPAIANGELLTYTISVTNLGPAPVTTVTLTDTLPAGNPGVSYQDSSPGCNPGSNNAVGCNLGSFNSGQNKEITITVKTKQAGLLENEVQVGSVDLLEFFTTNNNYTETTTVNPKPVSISMTKRAVPTGVISPGDPITYTIIVTNTSNFKANDVILFDNLPSAVTIGSWLCQTTGASSCSSGSDTTNPVSVTVTIQKNHPIRLTITGTIDSGASAATIVNTAVVTIPGGVNNSGTSSTNATNQIVIPPGSVTIAPTTAVSNTPTLFTATVNPIDVTPPLTYTWTVQDGTPASETHAGILSNLDTLTVTWSSTGTKLITVTVSNAAGTISATQPVTVN